MGLIKYLLALISIVGVATLGRAQGNVPCSSVVANYVVGNTYCITATGTSQIAVPGNGRRRYLLIQSETTADPVYFAESDKCLQATPFVAVVGTNTIQLAPQSPVPSNYEVSVLNNSNSLYLSGGAVAIITGGTSDTVCFREM